jgi:hypothetical protein
MAKTFFLGIFIILIIYFLTVISLCNIFDFNQNIEISFLISAILATANISLAFMIILRIKGKKGADFNKIFLGSMGVRFVGLLIIIFLLIKFANIHQIGFLVSLFLLYFIFQFWEIIIINKYFDKGIFAE